MIKLNGVQSIRSLHQMMMKVKVQPVKMRQRGLEPNRAVQLQRDQGPRCLKSLIKWGLISKGHGLSHTCRAPHTLP